MIKTDTICGACGKVNAITAAILKTKILYDSEGMELHVLHYHCPQCGRINVVQIDNPVSKRLLSECRRILAFSIKSGSDGQIKSRERRKKYEKLSKKLKAQRDELVRKYRGAEIYDSSGEIAIKDLTVIGDGDIIESKM